MADNYTQFCATTPILNSGVVLDIIRWLDAVEDYCTGAVDDEPELPEVLSSEVARDVLDNIENFGSVRFSIEEDELVLDSDLCQNIDASASILRNLLAAGAIGNNHPNGILLEWSNTCSRPRPDQFGGGACLITPNVIHWMPSPNDWARNIG